MKAVKTYWERQKIKKKFNALQENVLKCVRTVYIHTHKVYEGERANGIKLKEPHTPKQAF